MHKRLRRDVLNLQRTDRGDPPGNAGGTAAKQFRTNAVRRVAKRCGK
jgi:hypothetical protein